MASVMARSTPVVDKKAVPMRKASLDTRVELSARLVK
jgi:hypothetical protein